MTSDGSQAWEQFKRAPENPLTKSELAAAVRYTLGVLEERYPGRAVEVRVVPVAAVQVLEGVTHRRGTPPAVVEMDAHTWLSLAAGTESFAQAEGRGDVDATGERCDISDLLPLD